VWFNFVKQIPVVGFFSALCSLIYACVIPGGQNYVILSLVALVFHGYFWSVFREIR
jgi:hypothetical protein